MLKILKTQLFVAYAEGVPTTSEPEITSPTMPTVVVDTVGGDQYQIRTQIILFCRYSGLVENGVFNGKGIYLWNDGHAYDGDWKRGKKNGQGMLRWPNGNFYAGSFVNDKFHGMGTFFWITPYEGKYEGEWKNDKRTGKGILSFPDGTVIEGMWENDSATLCVELMDGTTVECQFTAHDSIVYALSRTQTISNLRLLLCAESPLHDWLVKLPVAAKSLQGTSFSSRQLFRSVDT